MKKGLLIAVLLTLLIISFGCKAPAEAPPPSPGPLPAAEFEVVSLNVMPPGVRVGETVSVTAEVKNTSDTEGTYAAILTIDGAEAGRKDITVAAGATETVTFSLVKDTPGTYKVAVGELSSTLTVKESAITTTYDLETAIDKMPELYAKEVSEDEELQYEDLISQLPLNAQRWITSMGQFMEDKKIDSDEASLLEVLASKEDPLFYLTMPQIIEEVTSKEIAEVKKDSASPQGYMFLKDDVEELQQKGLLSDKAKQALDRIISLAEDDYELRKGLYLISNFGHPNTRMFEYKIPDYNTQLFMLGKLLEKGIPEGYERVALAAALDYGSLITIGDRQVRETVPDYAYNMVKFIAETDEVVKEAGGNWQAKDYPLEADIALVWGAGGDIYPITKAIKYPHQNTWTEMGHDEGIFAKREMQKWEFDWLFASIKTRREIRQWLLKNNRKELRDFAESIYVPIQYVRHEEEKYAEGEKYIEIDGIEAKDNTITNLDWMWNYFKKEGHIFGGCVDKSFLESEIAKSANIASFMACQRDSTRGHAFAIYYEPTQMVWKQRRTEQHFPFEKATSSFGWVKVPWNNLTLKDDTKLYRDQLQFPLIAKLGDPYKEGLPLGYIYRRPVPD